MINRLGYACINMQLLKNKPRIFTGRSMIKRTFESKGISYASELALENVKDLIKILEWNKEHNFNFFRVTSNLIPWASEFDLNEMPDYNEFKLNLELAGQISKDNDIRITAHPGPFNVLTSPNPRVVQNCIKDLSIHGEVFDLMGLSNTPYNKINIHIGGVYGDKGAALKRFCTNFALLPMNVQSRLTVENDDKASMYSIKDLYEGVYKIIAIPLVFDYHHHKFCPGELSENDALKMAISTWADIMPVAHYSESKSLEKEDPTIIPQAHSDYVYDYIETYNQKIDIMIEAKAKELAVIKYQSIHLSD